MVLMVKGCLSILLEDAEGNLFAQV